ncbi:mercury methylation corrinoid protein HgcA, partial [candidate division KSB1 bacterium]
ALSAVILFPVLLPWIPTHNFSTKGFIIGFISMLPFVILILTDISGNTMMFRIWKAAGFMLIFPSITAYLSLYFTGATTFTSKSGVKREILRYFPKMVWSLVAGILVIVIIKLISSG